MESKAVMGAPELSPISLVGTTFEIPHVRIIVKGNALVATQDVIVAMQITYPPSIRVVPLVMWRSKIKVE